MPVARHKEVIRKRRPFPCGKMQGVNGIAWCAVGHFFFERQIRVHKETSCKKVKIVLLIIENNASNCKKKYI